MSHQCLSGEDLGAVLEMDPRDPVRVACEACPRCDSLLRALRDFLADDVAIERADRDAADHALGAWIHRLSESETSRPPKSRSVTRRMRLGRVGGWVLAAAAVIGGVMVALPSGEQLADPSGRVRGGSPDPIGFTVQVVDPPGGGPRRIEWSDTPGADAYRVEFFSAALDTVAVVATGTDTGLNLDPDLLGVASDQTGLYFRVRAFRAGDSLAASSLLELPPH